MGFTFLKCNAKVGFKNKMMFCSYEKHIFRLMFYNSIAFCSLFYDMIFHKLAVIYKPAEDDKVLNIVGFEIAYFVHFFKQFILMHIQQFSVI